MGNKLYVDTKVSEIEEILNFDCGLISPKSKEEENESFITLNNLTSNKNSAGYQNLKVWRFFECDDDIIKSKAILLPNIKEEQFLLSSSEAYIILLSYRGKYDLSESSAFPTSLWGIIESSSNMTPRGLKYAFSTGKSESLESFLLSKRDFKDSDFKYVLFIWNGKNCSPVLKSSVLMKAFDLDKKLSTSGLIPYLYNGHSISDSQMSSGKVVKLNEIINNTLENFNDQSDDCLLTPSSESVFNYQETVYLFQWLYPTKKNEKKSSPSKNNRRLLFKKFNQNFLFGKSKSFFDSFVNLDKVGKVVDSNTERNTEKSDRFEKSNDELNININKVSNEDMDLQEKEELSLSSDMNNSHNSLSIQEDSLNEDFEDDDLDLVLESSRQRNNISIPNAVGKISQDKLKINLGDITAGSLIKNKPNMNNLLLSGNSTLNKDKTYSSTETNSTSNKVTFPLVPKLNMKFQRKVLNDELISQRTKQISEDEEKLDSLSSITIRKASDVIMTKKEGTGLGLIKLDLKNLKGKNNEPSQENDPIINETTLPNSLKNKIINKLKIPTEKSETLENEQNEEEEEVEDLKESERKTILMEYFSKHMSEIIDDFLYLSSYNVAKNKELVYDKQITHIINAAGDRCLNHFEEVEEGSHGITYLTYNLKDHSIENIECLFYEVIEFISSVREKGGRVLVHCIQGISRSVSLVIAYLIFTKKMNYDEAFKVVQSKRSIASPNLGFSIQLQNFYQRLYESPCNFRLIPKIFAIGSFQVEQPEKIVCRLTQEQFFEPRYNNTMKIFDKRGLYIIVTLQQIFVWVDITSRESEKKKTNQSNLMVNETNSADKIRKYPDTDSPETLIDLDDLKDEDLLVACYENTKENTYLIYVWRGASFYLEPEDERDYVNKIKFNFFHDDIIEGVLIMEETPYSESDEFMNLL